ncbi:MAG: nicotinate phosphoribosyltransferase [Balneolaceae bacterium]
MIRNRPASFTDYYEYTMAQGYFLSNRHLEQCSFDYFFRSLPFDGGYVVYAGLADFLEQLKGFTFHEDEIEFFRTKGFHKEFLDYLKTFRFKGTIYSVKEGEIVFPNEPILRVEGTIIEAQIIETLLLNILNFESLIATKASRIRQVAGNSTLLDFGLRRSQGFGGIQASKAAIIGGFDGTSNVHAGLTQGLEVSGTMAHSWVQSFEDELTAFRTYAGFYPDSTVLLVDTYNTLKSGLPNTITVAKEMEVKGHRLKAIRLDSGDLAYLAKNARKQLDAAGLDYVQISASNQLDEYVIKSLIEQKAPIDIFGVGTKLVTAYDDPALDGVYKLGSIDGRPTLKVSENVEKVTMPGIKKINRYFNEDGSFYADGLSLGSETNMEWIEHPLYTKKRVRITGLQSEELLHQIVLDGEIIIPLPTAQESAKYATLRLDMLNSEHKRFDNPHVYKVGIDPNLNKLKNDLINSNFR